jgi:uncharacterized protein YcbK (DUF882 family)
LLPIVLKIRLMTTAMAGWTAAAAPTPMPADAIVAALAGDLAAPIEIDLYDENDHQHGRVAVFRDGTTDEATQDQLKQLFRCRRTHRQALIHRKTLAMLADVAEHYPGKTIEYVSAFRIGWDERRTSPHRDARAIDFRIRGIQLRDIRDYLWKTYTEVGVGWYPESQFVHIDARPTMADTAWTFVHGRERYHPYWAELARQVAKPPSHASQAGS